MVSKENDTETRHINHKILTNAVDKNMENAHLKINHCEKGNYRV